MRRGSIVLVRERNTPAAKSRPCVVVQRDSTISVSTKLTAVPLSSTLRGASDARPLIVPTPDNGLACICQAEVDWVFSFGKEYLGPVVGEIDSGTMSVIDDALRDWLDL